MRFHWREMSFLGTVFASLLALAAPAAAAGDQPDLVSLGIGQFDETFFNPHDFFIGVDYHYPHYPAVDFRGEYIFGNNLVPFSPYGALRPQLGVEVTSKGAVFMSPAVMLDLPLGPIHFQPSFGPGFYIQGDGKNLGNTIEFRTQLELAYQFDNQSRVAVAISHISNGKLFGSTNPGEDTMLVYYQFPAEWLHLK